MTPFVRLSARVASLPRAQVDTDQIIPKQFLTRLERTGYGRCCFHDWRWLPSGDPDPTFPLNAPHAFGAGILLAGENFGCGSSREHAAWALRDAGFRAILAPSFADIFTENCVNTGLLPAVVAPQDMATLVARAAEGVLELTVDLEHGLIVGPRGFRCGFTITPYRRERLLRGLDPIGVTLEHEDAIAAFEGAGR